MILKDKMFVIAGVLDDSIKRQSNIYDIRLFRTFLEFEKYINTVPVTVDTIILNTNDFAFTANNMARMKNILDSSFLKITGHVIYLVDNLYSVDVVNKFLQDRELSNWVVYQGDLSVKFFTDIITGEARRAEEIKTDIVTYRIRASEYYKQNSSEQEENDARYFNDEDRFEGIPEEEEPETVKPTYDNSLAINYVVGDTIECTVLAFLVAQYRALSGKTLMLEKDWEYHRLTNMVNASGVDCLMVYVDELMENITVALERIRTSDKKLVIVGARERVKYSYNFILSILESNLREQFYYLVRECDYTETPYGMFYTVVVPNNVPEVLRCCNKLIYKPDEDKVTFVGVQLGDLGPVNINDQELAGVISYVLEQNRVATKTVRINGVTLKGEEIVYDILGILNRGNLR